MLTEINIGKSIVSYRLSDMLKLTIVVLLFILDQRTQPKTEGINFAFLRARRGTTTEARKCLFFFLTELLDLKF